MALTYWLTKAGQWRPETGEEKIGVIDTLCNTTANLISMCEPCVGNNASIIGPENVHFLSKTPEMEKEYYDNFLGMDPMHDTTATAFLDIGLREVVLRSKKASETGTTEMRRHYAAGVSKTYEEVSKFILRHAEAAEKLGPEYAEAAKICRKIAYDNAAALLGV